MTDKENALEGLASLIEQFHKEFMELVFRFSISNLLFFLFMGATIVLWISNGLSITTYIASLATLALFFDGELIKNKMTDLTLWLSVLSELHGNLKKKEYDINASPDIVEGNQEGV
jgi:hypothetical protein